MLGRPEVLATNASRARRAKGASPERAKFTCAHCGRACGNFAGGYSTVMVDGKSHSVCHPNVAGRPDCYTLVTSSAHNHGVPCSDETCFVGES